MKALTIRFRDDEFAQLNQQACREGVSVDLYAYQVLKSYLTQESKSETDTTTQKTNVLKRFEKDLPVMKKLATIKRLPPI